MKYLYLKVVGLMFVFSWLMVAISVAQTLTTNEPVPQKLYEVLLKVLFPAIWTIGAPWVTGLVTSGIVHVPPTIRVIISTVLGAVMAGFAGMVDGFPLTVESAATMGAAGGGTGQVLSNLQPETLKPKTDATQLEIELNKKR